MSGVRCVTSNLRTIRRSIRLALLGRHPVDAGGGGGAAADCGGATADGGDEHADERFSRAARTVAGAVTLSLALVAADHQYNEKRFFKAARLGNLQELRRQVEAAKEGEHGEREGGGADRRHALGWTALMVAAANDQPAAVTELLRLGAHPDLQEKYAGASAAAAAHGLHPLEALQRREDEFCASMNARASFLGWTALHYAALADSAAAATALLAAGADPTARDHAGRRPLHYTKEPSPTRELIVEHSARWEEKQAEAAAEERRRFPLEQRLKQYIVGQTVAIETVAAAVRRKENGWADEEHPLVFLFLGSSGIGKTELAKQLARYMHREDPAAFIRLDMSEYQEKHEVAKLIGAPPGYVGHEEGGQLTRALARRADAVVLFDEVDKAHPDVLTVLLQLFDEGRLTDGKGKLIECKNAVFVMTSNLAADEIAQHGLRLRREADQRALLRAQGALAGHAGDCSEPRCAAAEPAQAQDEESLEVSRTFKDDVVRPILKRHFGRDEFLGRINEIVYFLPFSRQELLTLVQRELARWADQARARHAIELRWEGGVLGALADGYVLGQELLTLVQRELARWADQARARHAIELRWEGGVLGALADGYVLGQELLTLVQRELARWADQARARHAIELRWEGGVLGALADGYVLGQELLTLVQRELARWADQARARHAIELRWEGGVLGALADGYVLGQELLTLVQRELARWADQARARHAIELRWEGGVLGALADGYVLGQELLTLVQRELARWADQARARHAIELRWEGGVLGALADGYVLGQELLTLVQRELARWADQARARHAIELRWEGGVLGALADGYVLGQELLTLVQRELARWADQARARHAIELRWEGGVLGALADGYVLGQELLTLVQRELARWADQARARHAIELRWEGGVLGALADGYVLGQELLTLVQRELARWADQARARHAIELRWEGGVLGALADGYVLGQELLTLVQRELARWADQARARHAIELRWEGGVLGALADGYDVHYGARSIKHEVERRLVNQLALAAERGVLGRDCGVLVTASAGRLALAVRQPHQRDYTPLDLAV